jgi:hypothetical protein
MRYYCITTTNKDDTWGDTCIWWFEINDNGDANRQIQTFSNSYTISYDVTYPDDDYDGLQQMVVDGDEDWWQAYQITEDEFNQQWQAHNPVNRPAPTVPNAPPPNIPPPRFPHRPNIITSSDDLPF